MNRDPFDSLRSRNPVPPESLPDAPMTVATAITAGRPSLRRGLAIATATAAVVLAAGGGWLLWSGGGVRETLIGPPATATTTAPPAETTTTLMAVEEAPVVVVYFLRDGLLVPVARDLNVLNVRPLPDLGPLTMDLLLYGPGAWDAAPLPDPVTAAEAELTTAIPEGTELLGLTIADGIATVDLSGEFAPASPEALAQVVFTLTRWGAASVGFLIDGVPHTLVSDIDLPGLRPTATAPAGAAATVTRLALQGSLPPAMIENPALGGTLEFPGAVLGVANPTGGTVRLAINDADGALLWEEVVEGNCGTPWGACRGEADWSTFRAEVPAGLVDYGRWGTLSVSPLDQDGKPYAPRSQPVWLQPFVPFTDEPDLPEATTTSEGGDTVEDSTTTSTEYGLGDLRPFPGDSLTGCAVERARHLAAFEAALAEGRKSLPGLCAVLGPPDWETGSGLLIVVYDLADGGQVWLGYGGPQDLVYARWVGPGGEERSLLGE